MTQSAVNDLEDTVTFNSFWDATVSYNLPIIMIASSFNSFWDATAGGLVRPGPLAPHFQFLLGCYDVIPARLREALDKCFQFLLGCYGRL